MQRLEISGAVRPIYGSLGVKRLTLKNSTLFPQNIYIFCTCLRKKKPMISLYNLQRTAFITEVSSVYCAVRLGPLNKMDYVSSLNG